MATRRAARQEAAVRWTLDAMPDRSGRTVLVAGATSGPGPASVAAAAEATGAAPDPA